MTGLVPFTLSQPNGQVALEAFYGALGDVEMVRKSKEAELPKYKYTYADIVDVLAEVKRVCANHDLRPVQVPTSVDGDLAVTTTLIHASGEWIMFDPIRLPTFRDPQALGGAITYLRRYALVTIFTMATADDDAAKAGEQTRSEEETGYRSAAEARIHELIKTQDEAIGKALRDDFRKEFGPLSELPVVKHGDALAWTIDWLNPKPPEEPIPAPVKKAAAKK